MQVIKLYKGESNCKQGMIGDELDGLSESIKK
jgi:hypothetical protein